MNDSISRRAAIDALRAMQTYKLGAGDDMLLINQAEAQTELMMLPSAQQVRTQMSSADDLISRQAAIDEIEYELEMINSALDSITLDFNARERLRQRRGEAREILNSIQQLPSTQPEIIRCKDCKHGSPNGQYGCRVYHYKKYETHDMKPDDYCSFAERRTDGSD